MLTTDPQEIRRGSVGSTVFRGPEGTAPDGTVTIMGPDETPLTVGQVGEIVFGASRPVRYWREPDVAGDGWYRTGDLGWMDAQGRVHIVGRLKELVNRGGLSVSPAEVELAILGHPGVADAAVIARPDPVLGEAICACVVPAGGGPPDLAELRAFLAPTLARHKLPDELCLVEVIARTNIGKVDRQTLAVTVAEPGRARERLRAGQR
jgi:acyl-CoA synthetase (AMP-forming)/AMP-acid ligase II